MTRSLVHVEMGDTEMCVGCLLGGSPQRPRGIQMHLNYLVLSHQIFDLLNISGHMLLQLLRH